MKDFLQPVILSRKVHVKTISDNMTHAILNLIFLIKRLTYRGKKPGPVNLYRCMKPHRAGEMNGLRKKKKSWKRINKYSTPIRNAASLPTQACFAFTAWMTWSGGNAFLGISDTRYHSRYVSWHLPM